MELICNKLSGGTTESVLQLQNRDEDLSVNQTQLYMYADVHDGVGSVGRVSEDPFPPDCLQAASEVSTAVQEEKHLQTYWAYKRKAARDNDGSVVSVRWTSVSPMGELRIDVGIRLYDSRY